MFKFTRNKMVGVNPAGPDLLTVHGILEDDIYAVELTLRVRISDGVICDIDGRWKRWTTPECPRALDFLKEAEGLKIYDDIDPSIHKIVGRKACRHFANLMIECVYAAKETTRRLRWEQAKATQPELTLKEFVAGAGSPEAPGEAAGKPTSAKSTPAAQPASSAPQAPAAPSAAPMEAQIQAKQSTDGFFLDLHVHSFPASPCSSASLEDLIQEAKRIGLDGFCVTDHNYVWAADQLAEIARKHQFLILRGNEITTDQGDVIVFGFHRDVKGIIKLEELREEVLKSGGFIIVAHPFRGFLTFGAGELGLTTQKAIERPLFQWIDAVEVLNGKVTEKENRLAQEVATALKLPATGGSDAHDVSEIGQYATRFAKPLHTEQDLLAALRSGDYEAVAFRGMKM